MCGFEAKYNGPRPVLYTRRCDRVTTHIHVFIFIIQLYLNKGKNDYSSSSINQEGDFRSS